MQFPATRRESSSYQAGSGGAPRAGGKEFTGLPGYSLPRHHGRRHGLLGESRDHLVAIGHLPDGGSHHRSGLFHIVGNDAFVGIEVGVVRQAVVFDRVLREAYARQAARTNDADRNRMIVVDIADSAVPVLARMFERRRWILAGLSQRILRGLKVAGNHSQQDTRWTIRPRLALLPVLPRGGLETDLCGEF